ncbi:MAG: hypothetical protein EP349_00415 [Alphaproteobacteria bacterium]|nr:MAG: hypothetical protein EP349_00415 [Alphaproteobacteria bacterium]
MKDDFQKAIEKANLYAEQAMVVTLSFADVAIEETLKTRDGNIIEHDKQHYKPAETGAAFLKYLADEKIPHVLIHQADDHLTIALAREELAPPGEAGEENARAVVAGFFKDGKQIALTSEAYYQKEVSHAEIKNRLLSPVSPLRREVARNAARLNGK